MTTLPVDPVDPVDSADPTAPALTDSQFSGALVALRVPHGAASRVAHPEGTSVDDMHCTLLYIPQAAALSPAQRAGIREAARTVAERNTPPTGRFPTGSGVFDNRDPETGERERAYWYNPGTPELHGIRDDLLSAFSRFGISDLAVAAQEKFPDFNPHVTIRFLADDEEIPPDSATPSPRRTRWPSMIVRIPGEDDQEFPFSGRPPRRKSQPAPTPVDDSILTPDAPAISANPAPSTPTPAVLAAINTRLSSSVERELTRLAAQHNARNRNASRYLQTTPSVLKTVYRRALASSSPNSDPDQRVADFLSALSARPLVNPAPRSHTAHTTLSHAPTDADLFPTLPRRGLPDTVQVSILAARSSTTPESTSRAIRDALRYPPGAPQRAFALARAHRSLAASAAPARGWETQLRAQITQLIDNALTADGNSRAAKSMRARRQLRDRYGRWIEMGGGIRFKIRAPGQLKGTWYHGTAVGQDVPSGTVQVRLDDGRVVSAPAAKVEKVLASLRDPLDVAGPTPEAPTPNANVTGRIPRLSASVNLAVQQAARDAIGDGKSGPFRMALNAGDAKDLNDLKPEDARRLKAVLNEQRSRAGRGAGQVSPDDSAAMDKIIAKLDEVAGAPDGAVARLDEELPDIDAGEIKDLGTDKIANVNDPGGDRDEVMMAVSEAVDGVTKAIPNGSSGSNDRSAAVKAVQDAAKEYEAGNSSRDEFAQRLTELKAEAEAAGRANPDRAQVFNDYAEDLENIAEGLPDDTRKATIPDDAPEAPESSTDLPEMSEFVDGYDQLRRLAGEFDDPGDAEVVKRLSNAVGNAGRMLHNDEISQDQAADYMDAVSGHLQDVIDNQQDLPEDLAESVLDFQDKLDDLSYRLRNAGAASPTSEVEDAPAPRTPEPTPTPAPAAQQGPPSIEQIDQKLADFRAEAAADWRADPRMQEALERSGVDKDQIEAVLEWMEDPSKLDNVSKLSPMDRREVFGRMAEMIGGDEATAPGVTVANMTWRDSFKNNLRSGQQQRLEEDVPYSDWSADLPIPNSLGMGREQVWAERPDGSHIPLNKGVAPILEALWAKGYDTKFSDDGGPSSRFPNINPHGYISLNGNPSYEDIEKLARDMGLTPMPDVNHRDRAARNAADAQLMADPTGNQAILSGNGVWFNPESLPHIAETLGAKSKSEPDAADGRGDEPPGTPYVDPAELPDPEDQFGPEVPTPNAPFDEQGGDPGTANLTPDDLNRINEASADLADYLDRAESSGQVSDEQLADIEKLNQTVQASRDAWASGDQNALEFARDVEAAFEEYRSKHGGGEDDALPPELDAAWNQIDSVLADVHLRDTYPADPLGNEPTDLPDDIPGDERMLDAEQGDALAKVFSEVEDALAQLAGDEFGRGDADAEKLEPILAQMRKDRETFFAGDLTLEEFKGKLDESLKKIDDEWSTEAGNSIVSPQAVDRLDKALANPPESPDDVPENQGGETITPEQNEAIENAIGELDAAISAAFSDDIPTRDRQAEEWDKLLSELKTDRESFTRGELSQEEFVRNMNSVLDRANEITQNADGEPNGVSRELRDQINAVFPSAPTPTPEPAREGIGANLNDEEFELVQKLDGMDVPGAPNAGEDVADTFNRLRNGDIDANQAADELENLSETMKQAADADGVDADEFTDALDDYAEKLRDQGRTPPAPEPETPGDGLPDVDQMNEKFTEEARGILDDMEDAQRSAQDAEFDDQVTNAIEAATNALYDWDASDAEAATQRVRDAFDEVDDAFRRMDPPEGDGPETMWDQMQRDMAARRQAFDNVIQGLGIPAPGEEPAPAAPSPTEQRRLDRQAIRDQIAADQAEIDGLGALKDQRLAEGADVLGNTLPEDFQNGTVHYYPGTPGAADDPPKFTYTAASGRFEVRMFPRPGQDSAEMQLFRRDQNNGWKREGGPLFSWADVAEKQQGLGNVMDAERRAAAVGVFERLGMQGPRDAADTGASRADVRAALEADPAYNALRDAAADAEGADFMNADQRRVWQDWREVQAAARNLPENGADAGPSTPTPDPELDPAPEPDVGVDMGGGRVPDRFVLSTQFVDERGPAEIYVPDGDDDHYIIVRRTPDGTTYDVRDFDGELLSTHSDWAGVEQALAGEVRPATPERPFNPADFIKPLPQGLPDRVVPGRNPNAGLPVGEERPRPGGDPGVEHNAELQDIANGAEEVNLPMAGNLPNALRDIGEGLRSGDMNEKEAARALSDVLDQIDSWNASAAGDDNEEWVNGEVIERLDRLVDRLERRDRVDENDRQEPGDYETNAPAPVAEPVDEIEPIFDGQMAWEIGNDVKNNAALTEPEESSQALMDFLYDGETDHLKDVPVGDLRAMFGGLANWAGREAPNMSPEQQQNLGSLIADLFDVAEARDAGRIPHAGRINRNRPDAAGVPPEYNAPNEPSSPTTDPPAPAGAPAPPRPPGNGGQGGYSVDGIIQDRDGNELWAGMRVRARRDGAEGVVRRVQENPQYAEIEFDDGRRLVRSGRQINLISEPAPAAPEADPQGPPDARAVPGGWEDQMNAPWGEPLAPWEQELLNGGAEPEPAAPAFDQPAWVAAVQAIRDMIPRQIGRDGHRAADRRERLDRRNAGFAIDDALALVESDPDGALERLHVAARRMERGGENEIVIQAVNALATKLAERNGPLIPGRPAPDPVLPNAPEADVPEIAPGDAPSRNQGILPAGRFPADFVAVPSRIEQNYDARQGDAYAAFVDGVPNAISPQSNPRPATEFGEWGDRATQIAQASADRPSMESLNEIFKEMERSGRRPGEAEKALVADIFGANGTIFGTKGYQVEPQSISFDEQWDGSKAIYFKGAIVDRNGRNIGEVQRHILGIGGDSPSIYNAYMSTNSRNARGSNFAQAYNGHMENWYIANGIEKVKVSAGLSKGTYIWAMNGFNWASPREGERNGEEVIRKIRRSGGVSAGVEAQLNNLESRMALGDIPTPMEFALIGWQPGLNKREGWPGREAMTSLHGWAGVKTLKPNDISQGQSRGFAQADAAAQRVRDGANVASVDQEFLQRLSRNEIPGLNNLPATDKSELMAALSQRRSLAALPPQTQNRLFTGLRNRLATARDGEIDSVEAAGMWELMNNLRAEKYARGPQLTVNNAMRDLAQIPVEDLRNISMGQRDAMSRHPDWAVDHNAGRGVNSSWFVTHKPSGQKFLLKREDYSRQAGDSAGRDAEVDIANFFNMAGFGAIGQALPHDDASNQYSIQQILGGGIDSPSAPTNANNIRTPGFGDLNDPWEALTVAMTDTLLRNLDRHGANWMVVEMPDGTFKTLPIDNGLAGGGNPFGGWNIVENSDPARAWAAAHNGGILRTYASVLRDKVGQENMDKFMRSWLENAKRIAQQNRGDFQDAQFVDVLSGKIDEWLASLSPGPTPEPPPVGGFTNTV